MGDGDADGAETTDGGEPHAVPRATPRAPRGERRNASARSQGVRGCDPGGVASAKEAPRLAAEQSSRVEGGGQGIGGRRHRSDGVRRGTPDSTPSSAARDRPGRWKRRVRRGSGERLPQGRGGEQGARPQARREPRGPARRRRHDGRRRRGGRERNLHVENDDEPGHGRSIPDPGRDEGEGGSLRRRTGGSGRRSEDAGEGRDEGRRRGRARGSCAVDRRQSHVITARKSRAGDVRAVDLRSVSRARCADGGGGGGGRRPRRATTRRRRRRPAARAGCEIVHRAPVPIGVQRRRRHGPPAAT